MDPARNGMKRLPPELAWPLVAVIAAVTPPAVIAADLRAGEQVYKETCAACHAVGVANAPKFGDKKAWAPLLKEGQPVVTAHGWVGVRGMPPKGGNPDLSLEEFARATAFMARAGGGGWKDPDGAMLTRIKAEEAKRIEALKKKRP